jgi:hypothetical protein
MVLELKDASNKTICDLAFGEATSHAQQNQHKKNAIDHEGAKPHMPLRKERKYNLGNLLFSLPIILTIILTF